MNACKLFHLLFSFAALPKLSGEMAEQTTKQALAICRRSKLFFSYRY